MLPTNVIQMIFGIALCFFGGTYVASIAAIEAFRQMGWQKVQAEIIVGESTVAKPARVLLAHVRSPVYHSASDLRCAHLHPDLRSLRAARERQGGIC